MGLFSLSVCRGEGTSAGVRQPALVGTLAGLSLEGVFVTYHCNTLGSHAFTVSTCFILKPEWMTKAFPQAACLVFVTFIAVSNFFGYITHRDNDALRVLVL